MDTTAQVAQAAIEYVRSGKQEAGATTASGAALRFRADAQPPFDPFIRLCEDRDFKRAWEHTRRDLPDQSAGSYDLVLAECAVRDGWLDQDVVDLLIAHRARWIESLNLDGAYYTEVLGRAKAGASAQTERAATQPANRPDLIAALNRALGIEIVGIVKFGGNGGTFQLELRSGHKVDLGTTATVLNHRHVKAAISDATTDVIPPFKQPQWDKIAAAIFKCAGPAPVEAAPEQMEMDWLLRSRLRDTAILDIDERDRPAMTTVIRDQQKSGVWAFQNHDGPLLIHLGGLLASIHL
ncbi:MAG: hypothetical protein ABFC85_07025, partial [Rectinema sp.]